MNGKTGLDMQTERSKWKDRNGNLETERWERMHKGEREHHGGGEPHGDTQEHQLGPYWRRAHRDWKFWLGVVLLSVAIFIYVASLDLSLVPR
jgi:hypothetical protein